MGGAERVRKLGVDYAVLLGCSGGPRVVFEVPEQRYTAALVHTEAGLNI